MPVEDGRAGRARTGASAPMAALALYLELQRGAADMAWETYLVYLGVVAAFFATPPDTSQLLVMSNSLRHGVGRSLWTVAGDLSANTLQMLAAGFGLTALIALSADGLAVIKWLGVAYLAWLGLSVILRREPSLESASSPASATRPSILFRQGFLTSSANPYAVIFFGALFPQFIDPALAIWPQLLILGATYLVVDGVILVLWGWAATRTLGHLKTLGGAWLNRICGGLMIAAAGLLASKDLTAEAPR